MGVGKRQQQMKAAVRRNEKERAPRNERRRVFFPRNDEKENGKEN